MKIETTEQQDRVLDAMRALGGWCSPKEIAQKSGVNDNSVKSYLERFIHAGIVRKKGRGRYGLVEIVGTEETLVEKPKTTGADTDRLGIADVGTFYLVINTPTGSVRIPCRATGSPSFEGTMEVDSTGTALDQ